MLTPEVAYLDPGSGSMLLQLLVGGVAALGIMAKVWWRRALTFLGIRKREEEPPAPRRPENAEPPTSRSAREQSEPASRP